MVKYDNIYEIKQYVLSWSYNIRIVTHVYKTRFIKLNLKKIKEKS